MILNIYATKVTKHNGSSIVTNVPMLIHSDEYVKITRLSYKTVIPTLQ